MEIIANNRANNREHIAFKDLKKGDIFVLASDGKWYIKNNDFYAVRLSDGNAVYPIFELPLLNENYICKLYDINDAQRDKITFIIAKGKPEIDVNDSTADESLAEMWDIEIAYNGKILLPISTSEGLMFIDRTYLSPFADMPQQEMSLTLRYNSKSVPYFAIKFGMIAYGFIAACEIVDENLVNSLKALYIESDMILKNKKG